jgi:hypothetical protein
MADYKKKLFDTVTGGLLTAVLFILPFLWYIGDFEPTPYDNVELQSIQLEEEYIDVEYTFFKRECDFAALGVFGAVFEQYDALKWIDISLDKNQHQENRLHGDQTMTLRIFTNGIPYEYFEIRTRHDCDGRNVDKVFDYLSRAEGEAQVISTD